MQENNDTEAELHCPYCGCKVQPNSKFCSNCGKDMIRIFHTVRTEKRPLGLTVIAVLWVLGGIFNFLGSFSSIISDVQVLSLLSSSLIHNWFKFGVLAELGISLLVLVLSLIQLATCYGLWAGKSWAWKTAFSVAILLVVCNTSLLLLYTSAPAELGIDATLAAGSVPWSIIWAVIICSYLRKPHVKQYLGIGTR